MDDGSNYHVVDGRLYKPVNVIMHDGSNVTMLSMGDGSNVIILSMDDGGNVFQY